MRSRKLVITAAVVAVLLGGGQASATLTYQNPFHPAQCERAIAAAQSALSADARDARARAMLAQGLLCRGLTQDDPWALSAAVQSFEAQLRDDPGSFFTQLYVAEALRRRFPLSDAVPTAFARAVIVLSTADVGAARGELAAYVEQAGAEARRYREQFLPLLHTRLAALSAGEISTAQQLGELVTPPRGDRPLRSAARARCLGCGSGTVRPRSRFPVSRRASARNGPSGDHHRVVSLGARGPVPSRACGSVQ